MATHKVVKHERVAQGTERHLVKEKEFTRMRDQLSRERRDLPWELVEKSNAPSRASTGRRRSATSSRDAANW